MKRRRMILTTGTVAIGSILPGCSKRVKSTPTNPRELRVDSIHPIIDGTPKVQKSWDKYATVVTEKTDIKRFEQSVSEKIGISDWKPVEFPQQFISVASVVVPVTNTLKPKEIEVKGNECRYEFHIEKNELSDSSLPNPYLFNVIDLWELNGHSMPTSATVHIDGVDET